MAIICFDVQNANITSTTSTIILWPSWQNTANCISTSCTSTSCTNNIIYLANQTSSSSSSSIFWPSWHDTMIVHLTEEQAAALNQYQVQRAESERVWQEENDRQVKEHAEKQKLAMEKSKKILSEHLTPLQQDTIEKNGWFLIEGGKTGKLYRVKAGSIAGNVEELDADGKKVIAKYCCHLNHQYPKHDHHLAQKLMLEWDEETFLQTANKTCVG